MTFAEHLEAATELVKSWPEWKRRALREALSSRKGAEAMKAYHVATDEERAKCEYSEDYDILIGPDGFECFLGEPEDRRWNRDAAAVVDELNRLHEALQRANNAICVKEESESFPYEAVLHLARSSCHCQRSGPDVDTNAHLECCMVGRAQAYLGMHVTPLSLYRGKDAKP